MPSGRELLERITSERAGHVDIEIGGTTFSCRTRLRVEEAADLPEEFFGKRNPQTGEIERMNPVAASCLLFVLLGQQPNGMPLFDADPEKNKWYSKLDAAEIHKGMVMGGVPDMIVRSFVEGQETLKEAQEEANAPQGKPPPSEN